MLHIWTDGACSGSPGIGGWGWITDDCKRAGWGSDPSTTNQRMELQAALDALTHFTGDVTIHTDSAYVMNCFVQGWWKNWVRTNFKNNGVANRDLWEPLIDAAVHQRGRRVEWVKVKGHSGDRMNDKADFLAVRAKKEQRPTTRSRKVTAPPCL